MLYELHLINVSLVAHNPESLPIQGRFQSLATDSVSIIKVIDFKVEIVDHEIESPRLIATTRWETSPQVLEYSTDYTKNENQGATQGSQSNLWNQNQQNVPQSQPDPQLIKFNKNL
jgi:hypothetical protein